MFSELPSVSLDLDPFYEPFRLNDPRFIRDRDFRTCPNMTGGILSIEGPQGISQQKVLQEKFDQTVFLPPENSYSTRRTMKLLDPKTGNPQQVLLAKADLEGKAEVSIEWGGKDGAKVSGSLSGSVGDDRGNKVEVKGQVNQDGSGKVTTSAEHKRK